MSTVTGPTPKSTPKSGDAVDIISSTSDAYNALSGAIARSLTRALALYFARPVRLFRPSKVTGWMTLKSAAQRQNTELSPQYLSLLLKSEGWKIIPRHFIPPLIVNSALGLVLFESFTLTKRHLRRHMPDASSITLSSMSGAVAGTIHAIAGAPADNVRLLLEGGSHRLDFHGTGSGWRQAWLEVFRKVDHVGPPHIEHGQVVSSIGSLKTRREAREFRAWMKEVKGMARGWDGMWWGCGKDALGFAIFFAVFDASRQLANATAAYFDPSIKLTRPPPAPTSSDSPQPHDPNPFEDDYETKTHLPSKITKARIGHGLVLVSGGVVAGLGYEYSSRPFDNARRIVHEHRMSIPKQASRNPSNTSAKLLSPESPNTLRTIVRILTAHLREHGFRSLLRLMPLHGVQTHDTGSALHRRAMIVLRTLGRLGPWGIGFLMWEGLAPVS